MTCGSVQPVQACCTPWLYSYPIPNELFPSYGVYLGLPELIIQRVCQHPAHNGNLWSHEHLMFHGPILHVCQQSVAHKELFIWIVYNSMLQMAWLTPDRCMSILWFSFGVLPTKIPNIRGKARLYSLSGKTAWNAAWNIFLACGSFTCNSVNGLEQ